MNHCTNFKPLDIWYLNEDDTYSEKILKFGLCPICQKPVAIYIKFNKDLKIFEQVKKIGLSAQNLFQNLKKDIFYSASDINKQKFKPQTYKWVYGLNSENKKHINQYAKDFFGNKILIKKIEK